MGIVDIILIIFILLGGLLGFKKGAIKSLVALVGTFALVIIAFYLKDPVAEFLLKHLPFFNFSGSWEGLVTMNILLYESIAYILIFILLSGILSLLLKISGIIEKILSATIILGIPSKILGGILGLVETIFFSFIVLFVLLQFNLTNEYIKDSKLAMFVIDKTPIVGSMVNDTNVAIKNISNLHEKYKNETNKDDYNCEILNIMLNYNVVSVDTADELIKSNKLDFKGASIIVNSHKGDNDD